MRTGGELSPEEFQQANADFAAKIFDLEEELRSLASRRTAAESFIKFAQLQLLDLAGAWKIAGPEERQRVQNLLFEDGSGLLSDGRSFEPV